MMAVYRRYEAIILGTFSMIGIVVLWQISVERGYVDVFFLSTPKEVLQKAIEQIESGELGRNFRASLYSFTLAFGLAAGIGIGLGVLSGWFRDVESALEPFIWFKYSAPTIAFYPLFVAWLGYGTPTVVAIAFLFSLTPIYANTLSGIKNVDQDLVRAARSFGARPHDIFFRVALPGSVPIVVAGLRLGVGRALTGVVVAELFGANAGLGYSIALYSQRLRTTEMMVSIVVVIIMGVVLTQMLSWVEKKTDTWRVAG